MTDSEAKSYTVPVPMWSLLWSTAIPYVSFHIHQEVPHVVLFSSRELALAFASRADPSLKTLRLSEIMDIVDLVEHPRFHPDLTPPNYRIAVDPSDGMSSCYSYGVEYFIELIANDHPDLFHFPEDN